jgi:hypothetical protein
MEHWINTWTLDIGDSAPSAAAGALVTQNGNVGGTLSDFFVTTKMTIDEQTLELTVGMTVTQETTNAVGTIATAVPDILTTVIFIQSQLQSPAFDINNPLVIDATNANGAGGLTIAANTITATSSSTNAVLTAILGITFDTTHDVMIGSTNNIGVLAAVNTDKTPSPDYVGECKACVVGRYSLPGNDTCINCPDGYSSAAEAAPSCTGCDKGKYFKREVGAATSCKDCNLGRFQDQVGSTICIDCVAGKYTPSGAGAPTCSECAGGRYHEGWRQTFDSWITCDSCLAGTYSTPGTTVCIICPDGTGSSLAAPACESCAAGLYRPSQAGLTWAGVQAAFLENIECDTDEGRADARCPMGCMGCPSGWYSGPRAPICLSCPAGYQSGSQAPSCDSCTVGKYQNQMSANQCKNCDNGKYSSTIGALICHLCAEGQNAGTAAASCDKCLAGKYQNQKGSKDCKPCPAGFSQKVRGAKQCSSCMEGTFSAMMAESCDNCVPGQYQNIANSTTCMNCPAGYYQGGRGTNECEACSQGKFSVQGKDSCEECKIGHYQDQTGQPNCVVCNAGMYQSSKGQPLCEDCPKGWFSEVKADECLKCALGKFASQDGKANDCDPCDAGKYTDQSGRFVCKLCSRGKKKMSASIEGCTNCEPGSANPDEGQATCAKCAANTRQHGTGFFKCIKCQPGRFVDKGSSREACNFPVPQSLPLPPTLNSISPSINATHIVLHLSINTTYRKNVVDQEASMAYINVEWCASADFADRSTFIMPYDLPVDTDQQSVEIDLDIGEPYLSKAWFFRVRYILVKDGWVSRPSVVSARWHTIGEDKETSCTNDQFLRTHPNDDATQPDLPLFLENAGTYILPCTHTLFY